MRKFVGSAVVVLVAFTIATAEEFTATIVKIDGDNVTFKKGGFGGGFGKKKKDGEEAKEVTLSAAGAKVVKAKFNLEEKKFEAGEEYEGGLKKLAEAVEEARKKAEENKDKGKGKGKGGFGGFGGGTFATIVTDKEGEGAKITEIRVLQFGGFGKKKKDAE